MTKDLTWFEAKDECVKMESALVVPQSDEETDFILGLTSHDFWINCDDLLKEGAWKCRVGNDEVKYRNWREDQPSNNGGNEHCAEICSTGEWNDDRCDSRGVRPPDRPHPTPWIRACHTLRS
ncbi:hepatic lectin-like [Acanthaster planci]|uniref:Hepatic lectin-like n=1 Tax=Acanthaster planci TaxID=133434 RepID=A0A8B7YRK8_ACAPL|nr:hepatic lectin-like [Acanthaster planci]